MLLITLVVCISVTKERCFFNFFTGSDTLVESLIKLVKKSPLNILRLPFWLLKGRASFKNSVALHVNISAEHLPYHESLLAYLRSEKEKGRRIILATAAHIKLPKMSQPIWGSLMRCSPPI